MYVPTNHLYIGDIFLINSSDVIRPNLSVREGIGNLNTNSPTLSSLQEGPISGLRFSPSRRNRRFRRDVDAADALDPRFAIDPDRQDDIRKSMRDLRLLLRETPEPKTSTLILLPVKSCRVIISSFIIQNSKISGVEGSPFLVVRGSNSLTPNGCGQLALGPESYSPRLGDGRI